MNYTAHHWCAVLTEQSSPFSGRITRKRARQPPSFCCFSWRAIEIKSGRIRASDRKYLHARLSAYDAQRRLRLIEIAVAEGTLDLCQIVWDRRHHVMQCFHCDTLLSV